MKIVRQSAIALIMSSLVLESLGHPLRSAASEPSSPLGAVTATITSGDTQVRFSAEPFADYLFYLFYRSHGRFPDLVQSVPISDIPTLKSDSFLPIEVALHNVDNYDELYKRASTYDNSAELIRLLRNGQPHFAGFMGYWNRVIAASWIVSVAQWAEQNRVWPVIPHLEKIERIKFPATTLDIIVMPLDPSGSEKPPTIFTTNTVPDIQWVIGHEGTHIILSGAHWKELMGATTAIQQMTRAGGSDYDIEEALCIFMQAHLSIEAGLLPKTYDIAGQLEPSPRRTLLLAIIHDWPLYEASDKNVAQFIIDETLKTFPST